MRYSDLKAGQKHGNLLLLERLETIDKHGARLWLCECICGNRKITSSSKVRRGDSCGCVALRNNLERGLPIGKRFGKLIVLKRLDEIDKFRSRKYLLKCDCGNEKVLSSHNLKDTKSCGCLGHIKLTCGEAAFNQLYLTYRICAKRRNLEFALTKEKFKELSKLDCHYCGDMPKQILSRKRGNGSYVYNGVDRLNSLEGYTENNCVACCGKCNKMKLDTNTSDFLEHVAKIYKKQGG